jgi:hypothetical protein
VRSVRDRRQVVRKDLARISDAHDNDLVLDLGGEVSPPAPAVRPHVEQEPFCVVPVVNLGEAHAVCDILEDMTGCAPTPLTEALNVKLDAMAEATFGPTWSGEDGDIVGPRSISGVLRRACVRRSSQASSSYARTCPFEPLGSKAGRKQDSVGSDACFRGSAKERKPQCVRLLESRSPHVV